MADKKDDTLAESVLAFLLSVIAVVVGVLASGFVLDKLWGWFVAHSFGVPSPGVWSCYGLALLIRYIIPDRIPRKDDPSGLELAWYNLVHNVMKPAVFLGFGYVTVLIRGY